MCLWAVRMGIVPGKGGQGTLSAFGMSEAGTGRVTGTDGDKCGWPLVLGCRMQFGVAKHNCISGESD